MTTTFRNDKADQTYHIDADQDPSDVQAEYDAFMQAQLWDTSFAQTVFNTLMSGQSVTVKPPSEPDPGGGSDPPEFGPGSGSDSDGGSGPPEATTGPLPDPPDSGGLNTQPDPAPDSGSGSNPIKIVETAQIGSEQLIDHTDPDGLLEAQLNELLSGGIIDTQQASEILNALANGKSVRLRPLDSGTGSGSGGGSSPSDSIDFEDRRVQLGAIALLAIATVWRTTA